jgi:hypothetical protein
LLPNLFCPAVAAINTTATGQSWLTAKHTLLQEIACTNRISKDKKRGYVVDYIGQ